jgi:2-polyprenyl-6-methoxyphenol hydroxylase-like FAD-dependent oxidoreductase
MSNRSDQRSEHEQIPILIIGGSLVGLSTAMFLGWHGIPSLVVERHNGTAIHPRAGHFHLRTIELFRSVGIEETVRRASENQFPPDGGISAVESLAGKEIANYIVNLNEGVTKFSPTVRLFMTQQSLEPIIRARAEELGATLQYSTQLTSFEQDVDGVTAVIEDRNTGAEKRVRAKYLVAADGNRSPVRERLGIAMLGRGHLSNSITIYFRANCAPLLEGRNLGVIYVFNSVLRGFFRLENSGNSGFLAVNTVGDVNLPQATNVSEGITEARCIELVRAAIGIPDIAVQIQDVAPWSAVAEAAIRFQDRHVFLVGDAAHVMPPNGGFGGNTGVQDAHNLAWKLAMALKGVAGASLLSTYDTERRPIGALAVEQAYLRYVLRTAPYLATPGMQQQVVDELSMEIGYRYNSRAILPEPGDNGELYDNPRHAQTRPGDRAPHLVLNHDGTRISTLDLFGKNFVMLAGPKGSPWCEAARNSTKLLGIETYLMDNIADPEGRFAEAYGISTSGAVIVRPDGFIGWRTKTADGASFQRVSNALASLLCLEVRGEPA